MGMHALPLKRPVRHNILPWALVGVFLAVLFSPAPPAGAFTAEYQCTRHQTLDFRFAGANWDPDTRGAFRNGALNWNNRDGLNNQDLVTVREVTTGGVPVRLVSDATLGGDFGRAPCSGDEILMNETNSLAQMRATGAHEVGHYLGLPHSGDLSYNGDTPATMATAACGNLAGNQLDRNTIAQTDEAALAWQWDIDLDNPATANASFENGTRYWGAVNATLSTSTSGGGSNGPTYGLVTRSASSGSIYVSDRIHNFSDNDPMYVQAASRDTGPATGAVSITLHRRVVDVPAQTNCDVYPTNGRNYNRSVNTTGWVVVRSASCVPASTTFWAGCATSGYTPAGLAVDVRAQFNSSRSRTIAVDYLRVALKRE